MFLTSNFLFFQQSQPDFLNAIFLNCGRLLLCTLLVFVALFRLSRSVEQELSHLDNAVPASPNRRLVCDSPVPPHETNVGDSMGGACGGEGKSLSIFYYI